MNQNNMQQVLEQMAADNPKLKAIMDLMKQQRHEQEENVEQQNLAQILRKETAKKKRLLIKVHHLEKELQVLEYFLEELALALGACPSCWATDDDCQYCEGNGHPGAFRPDKKLFAQYVLPAVRQMPWIQPENINGKNLGETDTSKKNNNLNVN